MEIDDKLALKILDDKINDLQNKIDSLPPFYDEELKELSCQLGMYKGHRAKLIRQGGVN